MTLRITVTDPTSDKLASFEIEKDEVVLSLKALVEVEFNIPIGEQFLYFKQQNLLDQNTLSQSGVQENDMIIVIRKQPQQQFQDPNVVEALQLKAYYQNNPEQLQYILHQNPPLANAVLSDDINELVKLILKKKKAQYQEKLKQMQRIQQLEADPLNPENQRMIEEEIQKNNIQSNLEFAQEHMPENFGSITMLYIEINVNKHPIQAFVDSGAQSTIMSKACAERCGIMRLVDTRYAGVAVGVGTQKILGRVHAIEIQILDKFISCSLTILDGDSIDFLLGLDMLKRFQCSIDLKENCLIFPNVPIKIGFLPEGQIKRHFSIDQEQQIHDKQELEKSKQQSQPKPQAQSQQPPQQQPAQQQAPTQAQGQQRPQQQRNTAQEASINTLVQMGFTRQEATIALRQTQGNVEMAAALLTQQKYGF